jgi:2-oxoglutarate/2-oxoacid ferredoxin oxidoreductase subunit alpha
MNAEQAGSANLLHLSELWPFPVKAVSDAIEKARRLVAVEVNATGQLATLIRAQTGRAMDMILRYDGRPFTPEYIIEHTGR